MPILEKINNCEFPYDWVDTHFLPHSTGVRKEIYLLNNDYIIEKLVLLFHRLFGNIKNGIVLYHQSWWDFCIDTWDFKNDSYDYERFSTCKDRGCTTAY